MRSDISTIVSGVITTTAQQMVRHYSRLLRSVPESIGERPLKAESPTGKQSQIESDRFSTGAALLCNMAEVIQMALKKRKKARKWREITSSGQENVKVLGKMWFGVVVTEYPQDLSHVSFW